MTDSTNTNIFYFPNDIIIEKEEYLVICRDLQEFKNRFPDVDNCIGNLEFKLGNDGDIVKLYNGNDIVDTVKYDNKYPWPTGAIGNGATLELLHPHLDNDQPENWAASQNYGTPGYINSVNINDIEGMQSNPILREFLLYQNYPNPFNSATKIRYTITKPAKVNLSIFDITGKKVAELINTNQTAGHYETIYEPKNLATGCYFYRMKVGQFSKIKKMLFLK